MLCDTLFIPPIFLFLGHPLKSDYCVNLFITIFTILFRLRWKEGEEEELVMVFVRGCT